MRFRSDAFGLWFPYLTGVVELMAVGHKMLIKRGHVKSEGCLVTRRKGSLLLFEYGLSQGSLAILLLQ